MAGPVDLEELYGLERSEFIAARDALARHLRSAGRREEAAARLAAVAGTLDRGPDAT